MPIPSAVYVYAYSKVFFDAHLDPESQPDEE
jgi:hypothetical protein